ncbi:MAG TPA: hypothetical protein DC057_19620 [Spirochaetia bacterium]|nr:MAG: hypothetical protein US97_C0056G0007 [Microgenomates group bacterium GW2011_GWF1_38_5]HBD96389.1 hypothetical protein [Spirochaetia bacterium]
MTKKYHHLQWQDYEKVVNLFNTHAPQTLAEIGKKCGVCQLSVHRILTEYLKKKNIKKDIHISGLRDYMNDIRRREQMRFRYEQYKQILS